MIRMSKAKRKIIIEEYQKPVRIPPPESKVSASRQVSLAANLDNLGEDEIVNGKIREQIRVVGTDLFVNQVCIKASNLQNSHEAYHFYYDAMKALRDILSTDKDFKSQVSELDILIDSIYNLDQCGVVEQLEDVKDESVIISKLGEDRLKFKRLLTLALIKSNSNKGFQIILMKIARIMFYFNRYDKLD